MFLGGKRETVELDHHTTFGSWAESPLNNLQPDSSLKPIREDDLDFLCQLCSDFSTKPDKTRVICIIKIA